MNDPTCIDWLIAGANVAVAGAAGFGAWIAWRGLQTWRDQLTGGAEYETARQLLTSIYHWREAMRQARSPFGFGGGEDGVEVSHADRLDAGFRDRWKLIAEVRPELERCFLEARVVFGDPVESIRGDLLSRDLDFRLALEEEVRFHRSPPGHPPHEEEEEAERRTMTIYHSGNLSRDSFGRKIEGVVKRAEDELAPHLGKTRLKSQRHGELPRKRFYSPGPRLLESLVPESSVDAEGLGSGLTKKRYFTYSRPNSLRTNPS